MAEVLAHTALPLQLRLPRNPARAAGVLVSVHGISRNAGDHLAAFAAALPGDWAVIAPHFAPETFPHYQTLGLGHDEPRADLALDAALDALEAACGLPARRFHLTGFSGGAQFAHRYAMLNPARVQSLHLGAAGHYTFLDGAAWPYGPAGLPEGARIRANARLFLRLPIAVAVGGADTERDEGLRKGRRVDALQGPTRLDRARSWVGHLSPLRAAMGLPPVPLEVAPGIGHDFADLCDGGGFARRVAERIAPRLAA